VKWLKTPPAEMFAIVKSVSPCLPVHANKEEQSLNSKWQQVAQRNL